MTKTQLKEIALYQNNTNINTIGDDWIAQDKAWELEIIAELGEAIESTEHKWWKACELDMENLKLEIIDILHFSLSADIGRYGLEETVNKAYCENIEHKEMFVQETFRRAAERFIVATGYVLAMKNAVSLTLEAIELANAIGMSNQETFVRYKVKNALNAVRLQNGYKDGSYIKEWGKGKEDNEVAFKYIFEYNFQDLSVAEMTGTLDRYYKGLCNAK